MSGNSVAFPGILVNSIKVKQANTGTTREFGEPIRGPEFESKMVRGFVEENAPFSMERSPITLKYNLTVKAMHPRAAKMKARAFTRLKNIFEPDKVMVGKVSQEFGMNGLYEGYKVVTEVGK